MRLMISIRKRYLYLSIISLDSSYQQGKPREVGVDRPDLRDFRRPDSLGRRIFLRSQKGEGRGQDALTPTRFLDGDSLMSQVRFRRSFRTRSLWPIWPLPHPLGARSHSLKVSIILVDVNSIVQTYPSFLSRQKTSYTIHL